MDSVTISKAKPPHKSMDYNFLREEGLRHIEKLAGSLWTDYNSHDPGITLLEVLCYAITDLGYRTNFPVEDLLASSPEQAGGRDFFRIPEILPCNPVTLTDLRKLIIGYKGIRNAWVEKLDTNESDFKGLYNVTLELEDHLLGDLNFIVLKDNLKLGKNESNNSKRYEFDVAFSSLDDLSSAEYNEFINHIDIHKNSSGEDMFIRIEEDLVSRERFNDYYAELILNKKEELVTSLLIKFSGNFDFEDHELQQKLMEELLLKKLMEELLEVVLEGFPEDTSLQEFLSEELLEKLLKELPQDDRKDDPIVLPSAQLLKEKLPDQLIKKVLKVVLVEKIRALEKTSSPGKELLRELKFKLNAEKKLQHTQQNKLLDKLNETLTEGENALFNKADLLKKIQDQLDNGALHEKKLLEKILAELLSEVHQTLLEEILKELQTHKTTSDNITEDPGETPSESTNLQEGKSQEALLSEQELEQTKLLKTLVETLLEELQQAELQNTASLKLLLDQLIEKVQDQELKQKALQTELWERLQKKLIEKKENKLKELILDNLLGTTGKGMIAGYWNRVQKAHAVIKPVTQLLHNHRPLCEDFNSVKTLRVQEISIMADIDLATDAKAEEVLSEIYYHVHNFLLPRPRFYTLETLLNEGKRIEDIFEGPLLQKGFLDTDELDIPIKRETIYTSDIQQILTNIPGLVAVRNLRLTNYLNNNALIRNAINCLGLYEPRKYKPLLSADKSRVSFYKDWRPVSADQSIAIKKFNILKVESQSKKTETAHILNPPRGENREVENYYSIQHHFPPAYGMGSEQLPPSVPASHEAKILQLKAYLLFFEQLLANYFAQLTNLRSLFSMEADIKNTYFSQSLIKSVPEANRLLNRENYEAQLSDIAEPTGENKEHPGVFHKRRNRFLDHLMGRFCESFSDYALFLYTTTGNKRIAGEELIASKAAFLKEYPALSHDRARAFNYLAQQSDETNPEVSVADVWNTNNVSGLKKNIVRRLGLESYKRKHLFDEKPFSHYFIVEQDKDTNKYGFRLNNTSYSLESLRKDYMTVTEAEAEAMRTAALAMQKSQYRLTGSVDDKDLYFELTDEEGIVIAQPEEKISFTTEEGRDTRIQNIINFLSIEGNLHIVEHLLLRPTTEAEKINKLLSKTTIKDPYSFRISVILPTQHKKLGNPDFRGYAEKVIHSETPAHIVPHIYWVDIERMYSFELCYKDWLEKRASLKPDAPELAIARNKLVRMLNDLDKSE